MSAEAKWTSIEEALPPEGRQVQVSTDGTTMCTAYRKIYRLRDIHGANAAFWWGDEVQRFSESGLWKFWRKVPKE
jgi:hypothetical protein